MKALKQISLANLSRRVHGSQPHMYTYGEIILNEFCHTSPPPPHSHIDRGVEFNFLKHAV